MTFLHKISQKILRKNSQNNSGINPTTSQQPVVLQVGAISPQQTVKKAKGGIFGKIFWLAILFGIPAAVVWVANLPYPVIRRPVSKNAPILLAPSYVNMDNHYRLALTSLEQAEQLIEQATSAADLVLGEEKLKETEKHLNELPTWVVNDGLEYRYWWYDSRFSVYGFNAARSKVGLLAAKVFQEKNAQTLLTHNTQALLLAKQDYQQATTATSKALAIANWRTALNQLEQIPSQTLAGKTAQNQLETDKREFEEIIGLAAGSDRISGLIAAARQFSWQAAKAGQNPPHSVVEWQQIENLWSEAIKRLKEVSSEDVAGYAEAQKLLATYETNLGQVRIRKQAEEDSLAALESAQREIQNLLASIPKDAKDLDRNRVSSDLQGIINRLEKVQNGTTAYLKAQELLLSAKNKLRQLQPK
ncbi:hypothetical protein Cylst_3304 [Cylindrospermum stagnale PCC 7417]|uniref:Uncharacterized protein n=1 Tax=Cylindrospermum stagnale PCC 7417 TaxID=56107 RepID=K9X078_9NOST|nr:hypothetical protein [Cylindrospermum stagnale]AFZ25456.1 hypothetical protein Cylst_3304 [Cylindrospermum stagnale PCC 7417]